MSELNFNPILWKNYLIEQENLCNRLKVACVGIDPYQFIGLAENLLQNPINGLRHRIENNSSGWFIWTGEFSEADDFFKPIHVYHLLNIKPELLKYLGLPIGYRFQIDNDRYEDVWYDESLLLE